MKRKDPFNLSKEELNILFNASRSFNQEHFAKMLAKRMGTSKKVSQQTISNWLNGIHPPSKRFLIYLIDWWDEIFRLQPA